jgi:hypothetical protein
MGQELQRMVLWIERYDSICYEWLEALAQKNKGSGEVWGFFGDFCTVWSG